MKWFRKIVIGALRGTRPLLGPASCNYVVSCTEYAIEQLTDNRSFISVCWLICKRIISCNPLFQPRN